MNEYSEFKKMIGYSTQEIVKATGYTRQGLYNAFNILDQGWEPSKQFLVCINAAIEKKIQEETIKHEEWISKLRELQSKYSEIGG